MNLQQALERHDQVAQFLRKHRIGLLTLLFTDIVGSTQLKQERGDREGVALIQRHHDVIQDLLGQFGEAEEIDRAGDSFFLVFAKPSDAVKFSLLLHARLRALAQTTGVAVFDRVGIHTGEVFIEEAEGTKALYGIQVDTCARVMSLAQANQVLLTRSAFDNARQALKGQELAGLGGLTWLNHGPYAMKGLEEPVEVCEVGETALAPLQPPPDSEKCRRQTAREGELVLGWRPALGQTVPGTNWVLEEKLGEGGFGEVWLAHHEQLSDRRVFKFCFRADRVRSLKREVTLARLQKERVGAHPNLVHLLDVFFDEPPYYLEMEYVPGRDLRAWCQAQGGIGQIPLATRLELIAQVADGLQAAHAAGVIHRDIKPGNILISDLRSAICDLGKAARSGELSASRQTPPQPDASSGALQSQIKNQKSQIQAKLSDFGIGQVVSQEYLAGLTRSGFTQTMFAERSSSQTGTQIYMAPELLAGQPASPQSDLYALGVVLYQLIVEDFSRPVTADWADDVSDELLREDLWRCFAGNPQARFATAGELAQHLRSLARRAAGLKRRASALGALLTSVLSALLLLSPLGRGLILSSYDLLFRWPATPAPAQVAIIYLDDAPARAVPAYSTLSQRPDAARFLDVLPMFSRSPPRWNRAWHARLLDRLTADGAKAVVWDTLFHDPGPDPSVDAAFARALKANGKVILASAMVAIHRPDRPGGVPTLVAPLDVFQAAAAGLGIAEISADLPDLVVRRHPRIDLSSQVPPPLSWVVAGFWDHGLTNGAPPRHEHWINYYGPADFLPTTSYLSALSTNEVPAGFFRNKIVLIGSREILPYRHPLFIRRLSDCEVQATLLLNLVRRDWLVRPPLLVEVLLLSAFGALLGAGLVRTRRLTAGLIAAAAIPALFLLAVGLKGLGLWFPWLIVAGVQVPTALLWAILYPTRTKMRTPVRHRTAAPSNKVTFTNR